MTQDVRSHSESQNSKSVFLEPDVLEYLFELRGIGGEAFVVEIVTLFIEDAGPRLAAIHAAARRCDGEAMRCAAHSLKGSAANLGATKLAALSAELELRGRANQLAGVEVEVQRLEQELSRVIAALRAAVSII